MDAFITAHDAKTNFGEMLNRVSHGEEIVITRNGMPAARIIPEGRPAKREMAEWIEDVINRRSAHRINKEGQDHISMRDLVGEGRR